jgi:hypothetical protein
MPDRGAGATEDLRVAAAAAVSALPGVARLEPTLSTALRRLRATAVATVPVSSSTTSSGEDGIQLVRRGDLVDVDVDITAAATQPADRTARAVRSCLRDTIAAHHFRPGDIAVTVLKLEGI